MDLETVIQKEVDQKEKNKYRIFNVFLYFIIYCILLSFHFPVALVFSFKYLTNFLREELFLALYHPSQHLSRVNTFEQLVQCENFAPVCPSS